MGHDPTLLRGMLLAVRFNVGIVFHEGNEGIGAFLHMTAPHLPSETLRRLVIWRETLLGRSRGRQVALLRIYPHRRASTDEYTLTSSIFEERRVPNSRVNSGFFTLPTRSASHRSGLCICGVGIMLFLVPIIIASLAPVITKRGRHFIDRKRTHAIG